MGQKGQTSGEIINDFPAGDLAFMILGSLRFLVTVYRLSGYSLNMKELGLSLIENVSDILKKNNNDHGSKIFIYHINDERHKLSLALGANFIINYPHGIHAYHCADHG